TVNVSAMLQDNFSEDETDTQLGDNYLGAFWGAYVPHGSQIYAPSVDEQGNTLPAYLPGGLYGLNCAPVGGCTNSEVWPTPPELTQLLDSRPNPDAPWSMSGFKTIPGNRSTLNVVHTDLFLVGFVSESPVRDWTWEAYVSHGSTDVSTVFAVVIAIERDRFLVNLPN